MKRIKIKRIISIILTFSILISSTAPKKGEAEFFTTATFVLTAVMTGGAGLWAITQVIGHHSSEYWDRRYWYERGMGCRNFWCHCFCCFLPKSCVGRWADIDPPEHDPTLNRGAAETVPLPLVLEMLRVPSSKKGDQEEVEDPAPQSISDFFKVLQQKDGETVIKFGTNSTEKMTYENFLRAFKKVAKEQGYEFTAPSSSNLSLNSKGKEKEEEEGVGGTHESTESPTVISVSNSSHSRDDKEDD